jgi:nucleotidyltransferase substrate binding protein (TIGR01987 family)
MKKIDNFIESFANLHDIYDYEEPFNNVEITGLVGLYEICFEQSWKAMKEYLIDQGFPESKTGSPRQILKTAFESGLIVDEEDWLDALADRNNVAHAYNKDIAIRIIKNTKDKYYGLFEKLKARFEE